MPGFGGYIKKENRIPTWHGGPHGPRYAPYPYNPNAKPAPGHRRHPDATSTASARSLGGQTPTNPMGGGRTGGGGFGQSPPSTSYMGGGGNFGPAPPGKVRGQDGQLYDYRGPTDAQGSPDLSNLPGGGAIRHGGMRGGFGGGRAQSNAFSNYSRSLRNRRMF